MQKDISKQKGPFSFLKKIPSALRCKILLIEHLSIKLYS